MSRPRTPAATSDTFSDPGSLSDLESGWTDLSSTRSGGHVRTSSVNGDVSDGEDLLFEERFGEYTWEGVLPGDNDGGDRSEGELVPLAPDSISSYPSPLLRSVSGLHLNNISPLPPPGAPIEFNSSSYDSIRGSRSTLRLSFPDPLSGSREDILPPYVVRSKHEADEQRAEVDDSRHLTGSFSSSEGAIPEIKDSSSFVLGSPSPRFAVIFLGYNPLRSLKSSLLDFLLNAIVTSLEGFHILSKDLQFSRTMRVAFARKTNSVHPGLDSGVDLNYIFISDRTTSSDMHHLETLTCPTLAVVFLQPPNRCPSLSNLPHNVKYLPIMLHSLGNDSISSLLDLSPSILFDSTQLSISLPDNSRHLEALRQCQDLGISESRIDGPTADILTVEQLTVSPPPHLSDMLKEFFFTEDYNTTRSPECGKQKMVTETTHPIHVALATNMAKALGVSVIAYETKPPRSPYRTVDSTTVCVPRISSASVRGSPLTLESSPTILTLDPPIIKALTLTPKKSVIKKIVVGAESISKQGNSLALRLTTAVSPFVGVVYRDIQNLLDAIDALLRAVKELQTEVLHSFGGLVDVIKEQTNRGIQDFSNKVSKMAHSLGELAFYRHGRAQNNARKVKAAGEHYITCAKQRFRARWKRARGNAGKAFKEGLFTRNAMSSVNNGGVDGQRQMREETKNWRRRFYV